MKIIECISEPIMAIYNYMHTRHINQSAIIKNLKDMYMK